MDKPILLTVLEASKILRVQRAKIYVLIEIGALRGAKVGGDWRIRTDSLESLIGDLPNDFFKELFPHPMVPQLLAA